jgi:hypothetical protein
MPASAVGHDARVWLPNSAENVIIIRKKEKRGGRGEGSEEEVVNCEALSVFRLVRGNTLILNSLSTDLLSI